MLSVAVFGTSAKKYEKRVPIHPLQLEWIDENVRENMFFEEGYGKHFGFSDARIAELCGGIKKKEELFESCDIVLQAKPVLKDFQDMKPGTIHWGWPHCVQQADITQTAIDRKLTLIAWESMHRWSEHGDWQMHIFHQNNEIAGYAGVMHSMSLLGIDGNFGPKRKAVVISFGSVSRGALRALISRGILDITVYTKRHYAHVADQFPGVLYFQFDMQDGEVYGLKPDQTTFPFIDALIEADIIVNGILQDTDFPLMFVRNNQVELLKPNSLILDISCDEGMGFEFAKPTEFDEPMFKVGKVNYYAVDHTPSYLWNAASWEISKALISYLPIVMQGESRWNESETIKRAIEIKEGVIVNPKILSFQKRLKKYPHPITNQ